MYLLNYSFVLASQVVQMVKNLPAMQETQTQSLGWENPLEKGAAGEENGNPLQYSWLEKPMDRSLVRYSLGCKASDTT